MVRVQFQFQVSRSQDGRQEPEDQDGQRGPQDFQPRPRMHRPLRPTHGTSQEQPPPQPSTINQLLQEETPTQTLMPATSTVTQEDQSETRSTPSTSYSPTTPPREYTASSEYQAALAVLTDWMAPKEEGDSQSPQPEEDDEQSPQPEEDDEQSPRPEEVYVGPSAQPTEEQAPLSPTSHATEDSADEDPEGADDVTNQVRPASVNHEPERAELARLTTQEFQCLASQATPEQARAWQQLRTKERH